MRLLPALFAVAFVVTASAQPFNPIPGDRSAYTIDFARHFYATPAAEAEERRALDAAMNELARMEGHLADSAPKLERALALYEEVLVRGERLGAYLYLRYATDTKNLAARDAESELSAQFTTRTEAVQEELARIRPEVLQRYLRVRPSLREYERFLTKLAKENHPLPSCDRAFITTTQPLIDGWQSQLHDVLMEGVPSARSDSPIADERRAAFVRHYEALRSRREAMAFALIHLATARNAMARLRGYEDAAAQTYARSGWRKADVTRLLEDIARHGGLYKSYQRLGAQNVWDVGLRAPDAFRPRFTIDDARKLLVDIVTPLGDEYRNELAKLLDPAERRLDIVPGPNRRRGGFSKGFPGTTSVFFAGGFGGEYNDLRVLMHESTHAIHRQLQTNRHVKPVYAYVPKYVLEATAIFNELLLADTLAKRATEPAERAFYLNQFLQVKGLADIFVSAAEGALEQAIYEGVAAGRIRNADDLDALTRTIFSRYSTWYEQHPELAAHWMEIPLLYEDPFYDVNYAFAGVVALNLFADFQKSPAEFAPSYIDMMAGDWRPVPLDVDRALAESKTRVDALTRQ